MSSLALIYSLVALAAPAPYAKVLSVSGRVSREPAHTDLTKGAELGLGDRVTVMSGSRLRLSLSNGMLAEIAAHSEFSFWLDSRDRTVIRLAHGAIYAVAGSDAPLEVSSGSVKAHFHGRAFVFEARGDKPTFVSVPEGGLSATWGGGKASVGTHGAVLIHRDRPEPIEAKPRAADEAILKELRALL